MPASRAKTESESADFFTKPAETDCLQDFENRNNTVKKAHKLNKLCCCYLDLPCTAAFFWLWLSYSSKQSCYTGNFTPVSLNCCSSDSGKVSWRSELAVAMYSMSPLKHPVKNSTCISTAIGLDTTAPTLPWRRLGVLLKVKVWLLLPITQVWLLVCLHEASLLQVSQLLTTCFCWC